MRRLGSLCGEAFKGLVGEVGDQRGPALSTRSRRPGCPDRTTTFGPRDESDQMSDVRGKHDVSVSPDFAE